MVIVSSIIGMMAILYSTLNGRMKEMALLRIVGASPTTIFGLMLLESLIISITSIFISVLFIQIISLSIFPFLDQTLGIYLEHKFLSIRDLFFLTLVLLFSLFISVFPSIKAYKKSVNNGI